MSDLSDLSDRPLKPELERYLKRATRGLSGQKRREVQAELRGAVEDKVYRHTLLGRSETQATAAALRELGDPNAIARELHRVHSLPQTMKFLALAGLTGFLSLQAAAQVTTVHSMFNPEIQTSCRLATQAELALMSSANKARYDRMVRAQGGMQDFLKRCQQGVFNANVMLKVADLISNLQAAGVQVHTTQDPGFTVALTVSRDPKNFTPEAQYRTTDVGGEAYLSANMLIPFLKKATDVPLRLEGLVNPVLHAGKARLQLGTVQAPVHLTDMLAFSLMDERRTNSALPIPVNTFTYSELTPLDPAAPKLALPGQEGDLFVIVQNVALLNGGEDIGLFVRPLKHGLLTFTDETTLKPSLVGSLAELNAATLKKRKAALVYRLDARNLRALKLTPVPVNQVKVVQP